MRTQRRTLAYVDDETAIYRAFKAAQRPIVPLTQEQRAKVHWSSIKSRIKTEPYKKKGIELRWEYDAFVEWFCSDKNKEIVKRILECGETPSIDRIFSNEHYEEANCRIIPTSVNRALGEVNALVSRMRTLQTFLAENEHWLAQ